MPQPNGRRKGRFSNVPQKAPPASGLRQAPLSGQGETPAALAAGPTRTPAPLLQFNPDQPPILTARVQAVPAQATAFAIGDDLRAAKQALKAQLVSAQAFATGGISNIQGLGLGEKLTSGHATADLAVKVYVVEKSPLSALSPNERVPEQINGIPTDVEEVGVITALGFQGREKPANCGSSIGHFAITAGTLGCLVALDDGSLCILSNNHVLANVNDASVDDRIVQPGPVDGGTELIAKLLKFKEIRFDGLNEVDAAVAFTSFDLANPEHHSFVIDTTPIEAILNMPVRKEGRTTGHRLGSVVALEADITVGYGSKGQAQFTNQIQIRGNRDLFSQGGDSGSLVVEANSFQPVGLLFSGGSDSTFANPIQRVIDALGIARFLNAVEG
jgi:hypothetical protein